MGRISISIDDNLLRKARQPTELSTNRESVNKALELLVRSETVKAMLQYYGRGIWKGDLKWSRKNRV